MINIFKKLFSKRQSVIETSLEKVYEIGLTQGRVEVVNELIDLHDGNITFLEALKITQAKNADLITEVKKKSL